MQRGTIIQKFQTYIRETSPPVLSTASCMRVVPDATSMANSAALTTAEKLLPGYSGTEFLCRHQWGCDAQSRGRGRIGRL